MILRRLQAQNRLLVLSHLLVLNHPALNHLPGLNHLDQNRDLNTSYHSEICRLHEIDGAPLRSFIHRRNASLRIRSGQVPCVP